MFAMEDARLPFDRPFLAGVGAQNEPNEAVRPLQSCGQRILHLKT